MVTRVIIMGPIYLDLDQCFDFARLSHFQQHIAKQRVPGIANDLMKKGKHFILIRSPMDILVKYFMNFLHGL